jgi:outer membrane protein assembly factor BamC
MIRKTLPALALVMLSGCFSMPESDEVLPDRKVEYKRAREAGQELEVPPDLSSSSIRNEYDIPSSGATYSDYAGGGGAQPAAQPGSGRVLPQIDNVQVRRDGDRRWLVIKDVPDNVWLKVTDFWHQNGILLVEQDPEVGIMVTDWVENRADIKSDIITNTMRMFVDGLYSAATRDQFRVRLERGPGRGTTELFLTHRGMQEDLVTSPTGSGGERTVWVPRDTDHGLEAEMLRRLMVYMGVEDRKASRSLAKKSTTQTTRSQLVRNKNQIVLKVNEEFDRAWRLTGVALDRIGFAVEDRNRSDGIYYVRYNDPSRDVDDPGLLSKLAFWRDDDAFDKENRYQVSLKPDRDITNIMVKNDQGVLENSETAARILTLLHEQLR